MVTHLQQARDQLLANQRPAVSAHVILVTDGVPEHAQGDPSETVENLERTIYNMRYNINDVTIYTSVVGFQGEKRSVLLPGVLQSLSNYSNTWSIGENGLTKAVSDDVVKQLPVKCQGEICFVCFRL